MRKTLMQEMNRSRVWRGIQARFFMFKRLLFVFFLLALDIRDLHYKVVLQGPVDAFSFSTGSDSFLETTPLVSTVTEDKRTKGLTKSGWSSFLASCEELFTFVGEGSKFFLMTEAINCRIPGVNTTTTTLPPLVLISSVRVDSLAWAACNLLHLGRRPPPCGDTMVINFNKRYAFADEAIAPELMAPVGGEAEAELLRFLDLVGVSYPLHKMICVEGFPLRGGERGIFTPSIYACASSNIFRVEFVGFAATGIQQLQGTNGWLTEDALTIVSSRYGIRQNCHSKYRIGDATIPDPLTGAPTKTLSIRNITTTNFSSHGLLYAVVVILDILLLLTHGLSIAELIKWLRRKQYYELQKWIRHFDDRHHERLPSESMVPRTTSHENANDVSTSSVVRPFHAPAPASSPPFDEHQFYAFFPKSFYRSGRYRVMLLTTRLLSWVIVVPNSVTWTWSDSLWMKFQAYLCSIKSWVLVATVFTWLWRGVVRLNEPLAYRISRRTHLTNLEIITLSSLAALWQSQYIFTICEKKWQLENQRVNDAESFAGGYLAHGNTYQRTEETTIVTPLEIVWIIYAPLVRIILCSLVMIAMWLLLKALAYAAKAKLWQPPKSDIIASLHLRYARLPLEESLDSPIRALSIVRYQLSMEMLKEGQLYIRPSCYLDYGVMLKTAEPKRAPPVTNIFKRQRVKIFVSSTSPRGIAE